MTVPFSLLIRDAVTDDVAACTALDHSYETQHVWQMHIDQEDGWHVRFRTERLPRTLETAVLSNPTRLRAALPADQCFLVAARRDTESVVAYLSMRNDPTYAIGHVHDLVVTREQRHQTIGTRLLKVAMQWAKEHDLTRLILETQTKNYPAINFCQAAGFSFCGFNDQYYPNRDIAVFFSLTLR